MTQGELRIARRNLERARRELRDMAQDIRDLGTIDEAMADQSLRFECQPVIDRFLAAVEAVTEEAEP